MKVVHIINSEQIGGAERFLIHLWRASVPFDQVSHALWILRRGTDRRSDLLDEAARLGVPTRIVNVAGNGDPRTPVRLERHLRETRPDAVHTHLVLSQFVGRWAAARAGVPVIVSSEQNVYFAKARPPWRWIEQSLGSRTTRVIACSSAVREHLVDRVGLPRAKVVVVPNTIDPDDYGCDPGPDTPVLHRDPRDTVLGTVGRLHPQKGHDTLLRAFADLDPARRGLRLVVVGEGAQEDFLRRRSEGLGVASRVQFIPWQRRIAPVLRQMDLFVFPSLYEGFGIALLEAMWLGLPAVASNTGGIPEFAVDGETAVLVGPGDPRALREALDRLMSDPGRMRGMGCAARARAGEFTVDRLRGRVPGLYAPDGGGSS